MNKIKQYKKEFKYKELECKIWENTGTGFLCGYVEVGKDSPLIGKDYYYMADDEMLSPLARVINNIQVHGGVTYAGSLGENDKYYFGFDCGHLGDKTKYSKDGIYRDVDYVTKECEKLADQIININKEYGK